MPILAPTAGGAFLLVGSWHLIFAALGAIAVASMAWMALRLPETRPPEQREPLSLAWLGAAFGGGAAGVAGILAGAHARQTATKSSAPSRSPSRRTKSRLSIAGTKRS